MRKRTPLVAWIALVTLGSGLVNLYSVLGPSQPERHHLLREFFPLEFLHISKFLTLLIGFALVVSSVNLYKRKRRAYWIVLVLSVFSVIFHLTKGLDFEAAFLSLVLMALLFLFRHQFTVRSSLPDLRSSLLRLVIALAIAVGYGCAGFWFLDPREFGVNFNWLDSIRQTFTVMSLVADVQLEPLTRHALWFLDSLRLMSVTALVYAGFAVFRPVAYQFRTLPRERALAAEIARQYGRSSLDFFKYWHDKSFFFPPSHTCFVAYRVAGKFAVALGDPVGREDEIEGTIRSFNEFCRENDWTPVFHQTLPDFLPLYRRLGFKKLKLGDDAIVDLTRFSLEGKSMKAVRTSINKLEKAGIRVVHYDPPLSDEVLAQAAEVSDEWRQIPGRRERSFTLGAFEPDYVRSTPVVAALDASGRMLGFLNIIPPHRPGEITTDLMRRRNNAPNGIMDYLFVSVFLSEKEKGTRRFNLGMAPMSGFQEREEASIEERAIHNFLQRLNFIFSYRGLRHYKAKWATFWEPRYVIYQNALDLPVFAVALSKVSEYPD